MKQLTAMLLAATTEKSPKTSFSATTPPKADGVFYNLSANRRFLQTPGSNIAKLHHLVREPARTVDMVPSLAGQSLLSGEKIAEAGYI